MYSYAVKHHLKPANMEVSNYANLTPLTLASKLARNSIFKEIIELQSAVSCLLFFCKIRWIIVRMLLENLLCNIIM